MIFDKIDVSKEHKHLSIREISDTGGYHRRSILCNDVLTDDEHQEVKDKAEEVWTDEVKSAWTTFQAEQEAKMGGA
jgi:hypothetical protein